MSKEEFPLAQHVDNLVRSLADFGLGGAGVFIAVSLSDGSVISTSNIMPDDLDSFVAWLHENHAAGAYAMDEPEQETVQ